MTIQITRPEIEALIQQRLDSGLFTDAEDLIFQALQSAEPEVAEPPKDARPLLSKIRDIWRDMPDEVRAKLPKDGASQGVGKTLYEPSVCADRPGGLRESCSCPTE